jgi:hypothetical protein
LLVTVKSAPRNVIHSVSAYAHLVSPEFPQCCARQAPWLIESARQWKERSCQLSVKQGRQPNLEVADVPIVETEPDFSTPVDRIQYSVEGADRNPVRVLTRLKVMPRNANSVEANIQYLASRHRAS